MSDEVRYTTENQDFKYIEVPSPFVWNIFEKHRGKRVFNVPNDLAFCVENPDLVLKSDFDTLKKENEVLRKKLTVCMQQRDREIWQPFDSQGSKETIANYNQELESIKE